MAEKIKQLNVIKEQASVCTRCPALAGRVRAVFGEGDPDARVVLCGEAPGQKEDESGRPFVGPAGQLLDNILKACGWRREDVYILNCLKCRPPQNRTPTREECGNCRPYLDEQLKIISPQYLILMGTTATMNFFGLSVTQARGTIREYKGMQVVCTYHPSFLLRDPTRKKDVWDDLQPVIRGLKE